jgi:hypothetical protein
MKFGSVASLFVIVFGLAIARSVGAAEAFEVAAGGESALPQGKEADGIRGDFILRNDKVVALVSQNAPQRRANMSTFYGADGVTPGCLYDLTLREAANDQLVYFGPAGQRGAVSWVRLVSNAKDKATAAVETVTTAAKSGGIYKRHEYRIRDGEQGLWIISTFRNETSQVQKVNRKDEWTRFNESGGAGGVYWADAVDPADKAGYAYGRVLQKNVKGEDLMESDVSELAPHQEVTWTRFLAVGRSPMEAWSIVAKARGGKTGTILGTLLDQDGMPATSASVQFIADVDPSQLANGSGPLVLTGSLSKAYPDAKGEFKLEVPAGKYRVVIKDMGRTDVEETLSIGAGKTVALMKKLDPPSRIRFAITDESGRSIPCKAQFLAQEGTPSANLGPPMRAHGCKDQWHSERGDFTVPLPAGKYRIVVTHGIEFSHHEQDVMLAQGAEVEVKAVLKRMVDTTGWVSADFHNHSTPSGDNICGTPDRLCNIAAENIEFAPTTEHNRIYDWRPTIEKLGLRDEIQTVVGMELTGSAAHLNCFPLTLETFIQDNGAPVWNADARISALTLRGWQGERPDRWVQVNHPDHQFLFNDRNVDGQPDGGLVGIAEMVNGMETENGPSEGILADSPWQLSRKKGAVATSVNYVRQFIWRQLLNLGHRITPLAVSDAHSVHGNGVGGWRMYLPSKTDEPAKIDWTGDLAAHALKGHIMLTTGPFLQVTTADGRLPGDDVKANGAVQLKVKVQCTEWQDIDRVQVLVNSRKEPTLNFTRATYPEMFSDGVVKFDQTITVPLKSDGHIIVVVLDENRTLKMGYGSSDQARLRPMAYHAPIYVDTDGDGFKPNGDTLGFDIPVAKMTPDVVRAKLGIAPEPAPPASASGSK